MRLIFPALALALVGCGSHQPSPAALSPPPTAAPTALAAAPAASSTSAPAAAVTPTAPPPAPEVAPPPPLKTNVIVITIDSLRADMPWAGYPHNIAPRLSAFEKTAVSYTRAYALSSYTAMSMGGYLAGRYPGELKRSGYFFSAYPAEEQLFPELLTQAGVFTMAAHAHFYFEKKAGFQQGFADYRMVAGLSVDHTTDKNITSPRQLALAKTMLGAKANQNRQFFAWFHFMDPHDLYMHHDNIPSFGKGQRARYDGEVYFTDQHVGELIDFIDSQPWSDHTAVIVSADHGEAFGEHHMTRHAFELWEPLVHVPLMLRIPGVSPRRIDTPRSHIDLAPTIFELLAVAPPANFQGTSLLADVSGEGPAPARDVIIDLPRTSDNFRRRALVVGDYKLIAFGDDFRYELYNVVKDPKERIDLRRREKERYQQLKKRYLERVKHIKDICPKMRHKLKGKRPNKAC
ncbi:MAG TPA: choline-sulfatase [Sorangium sp.]|nr:choline-sulfatase [Sorangium sp.]